MARHQSRHGRSLVYGRASGSLLASDLELSFWGGIDPQTGEIIDRHHPLSGRHVEDIIFAIPCGRGSCSGSGVILELLLNGKGPKGLIFSSLETILTLGVIVARELFGKSIPVVQLVEEDFRAMLEADYVNIDGGRVVWGDRGQVTDTAPEQPPSQHEEQSSSSQQIELTDTDKSLLSGSRGEASAAAMRIILEMSRLQGARKLLSITQVHIDGCVYTGPGSLAFAEKLLALGGRVVVPTTLNSISVDQKRWRSQGVESAFGAAAERLATVYTDMGARPTFTCAPYLLESAPRKGEQVAWAESNAVVYANSVLGAKTMKYPDFLDIAIALTGRAPNGGLHIAENRTASLCVDARKALELDVAEDLLWPVLGYCIGGFAGNRIPAVLGLEAFSPSKDDLKAFGAAFATVSSAPMFHIVGVTPEARSLEAATGSFRDVKHVELSTNDLSNCFEALNTAAKTDKVDLISLGNPHFSLPELRKLATLCHGKIKHPSKAIIVCCGRSTYGLASQAGVVEDLEEFGVQVIEDTCWCMIGDPVIPRDARVIMTNSAKYAHYGPGLTGRRIRFGGLEECVQVACQGVSDASSG
ncbi:hypothetical protein WHR41_01912 [Cladosporium halotolerans]|uniref:DUF521 domain protein n=1 Tax=Cladosporium halotolerans TaxID=1052096 RepID=A0AB34KWE5_9PEZI